ncbi:MAG: Coenzyme F420 hydrogenase/dehydrogenase, beta subunit C-terminal domain [Dehalococcoidia bacterium]|nr:Coenzyme F420 hydrogenase/dehydrogenase, beta subunit C-terminal domain [Dehalococcoidia bacterium]
MYLAWSSDEEVLNKAEFGGAVTSLLKFALDTKRVDAVLAVKARDGNRYDGIPALITDPEELIGSVGALHCVSVNIPKCIKEYLNGAANMKLAVVGKPCDIRGIIELVKREQINLDNLFLVGLNCTGTLLPVVAKRMIVEEFGADPLDVVNEDIDDGKLIIRLNDGTEKTKDLEELEKKGYGRRENCQRCEIKIPTMADIACGKWGVTNNRKATFVEVCSDKGAELFEEAIKAGYINVEQPDGKAMDERKKKEQEAIESAVKWQETHLAPLRSMTIEEKFDYWWGHFDQCIKCYGCRDACPICYCKDCILEADRGVVMLGEVPPDSMFPMIRIAHVMDSCVNCGQCQDVCPANIPIARLTFMLNKELGNIFKYAPGVDIESRPPLRTYTDAELTMAGVELKL